MDTPIAPRERFFSEVRNALAQDGAADPEAAAALFVSENAAQLRFDEKSGRVTHNGNELGTAFSLNPALTKRFKSPGVVEMSHADFQAALRRGEKLNLGNIRLTGGPTQSWRKGRK